MSNRLKAGKHLLLSCSALFPVLFAGTTPGLAQAVNLGGAGNLIVPDGRTQTSVSSSGATTDIRTNTVRGQTGYNSFSKFEAGSGNTVNLHLPDGTGTLVNIVRDAPVVVEGTVNALKNGSIGGNVVFSDPYGFVLGKGGVINTGGLTVNTPTQEFLEGAIDAQGRIDTSKTDRLISGDVPLSPDGSVVIKGRVNAQTHIDINAQSIDIDGEAVLKRHRENFDATVNTGGGVAQGGALVVRNGRISLVAAGDIKIGGSVAARATSRESARAGAGRIAIKARNVTVTPTARIEALAEIARDGGTDAVAAAIGIEAAGALNLSGTIEARGLGGAGAAVQLSAVEDVALNGRIDALGTDADKGKRVDVTAGRDVAMGSAAAIDASGGEDTAGDDIYVIATRDLSVANGASVVSRGAGNADGGFAELSGHRAVNLGAVSVDLRSAGTGKAGTLLIDPDDIVIRDGSNMQVINANLRLEANKAITVRSGGSIRSVTGAGYDINLLAASITVENGGVIDSRSLDAQGVVNGKSGSITLQGSTIRLLAGSKVLAGGDGVFAGGDVKLLANDVQIQRAGLATAAAQVMIAGEVTGANISALAVARARSSFNEVDITDANYAFSLMDAASATLLLSRKLGLPAVDGGFLSAQTIARVDVAATANIVASGELALKAVAEQIGSNLGLNLTSGSIVQLTGFYGFLDADTAVTVASGAALTVGGDLTMTARNNATLDVNAYSIGLKETPLSGAFAVGIADVRTVAKIASGVAVSVGGSVKIAADNLNSFSVGSTVMALKDGVAGLAIAVQYADASATASLDSSIAGPVGGKPASVSVTSLSETLLNRSTAGSDLGDGLVIKYLRSGVSAVSGIAAVGDGLMKNSALKNLMKDQMPKGGAALALTFGSQSAIAEIGSGVSLDITGNLAVVSSVLDAQVRSNATASINDSKDPQANGAKTTDAVGVAIAYADIDHISHATIGNGATITAANVGVFAQSAMPINITYLSPPSNPDPLLATIDWAKLVISHANGNLGVVKNILTSYASTDVEGDDGLGATINYLGIDHDVLSWIGSTAKITTTDTSANTTWSQTLALDRQSDSMDVARDTSAVAPVVFNQGVDVRAVSYTDTINIAGNPAWLIYFGGNNASNNGSSFGGSVNVNAFSARTVAGIGAGAKIVSARDLRVLADRHDTIFTITPTSGKGAGFGINGILSLLLMANDTSASISGSATVEAGSVDLRAEQRNRIVTIAGAMNTGSGTNVGIAANWTNIQTKTRAFVGNNDFVVFGTTHANVAGIGAGQGTFTLDGISVRALTSGETYSLSVAGAYSSTDEEKKKDTTGEARDSLSSSITPKGADADFATKTSGAIEKLADSVEKAKSKTDTASQSTTPKSQAAVAGSLSGATIAATTEAYIENAALTVKTSGGSFPVTVQATNDSLISITSGGASYASAGAPTTSKSSAIAGAIAIAVTDSATRARISNALFTNAGATRVAAIGSGQQIVLGLAVAVNASAKNASAGAGSLSLGFVFDNVNAIVDGSTLNAKNGANADIDVKAYQNTDIGIGGAAVSVTGAGGDSVGLAITGTVIANNGDPTNASGREAVSARIRNSTVAAFRNLSVDAATLSRVISGGGSGGYASDKLAFMGSFVFNDLSATTRAAITGRGSFDRINVGGSVLVRSTSVRETDIEAEIGAITSNAAVKSGFDFSRHVLASSSSGAVAFGIAGAVSVSGGNGVGVSILYNGVRNTHDAVVSGVDLDAAGDVVVSAKDDTKIIGVAAGVGAASGDIGGAGSIVVQVVANATSASITGAGTTIDANTIAVQAGNTSTVVGGAGALGISLGSSGLGLGLSIINGTIANKTTALVELATVTARRDVDVSALSSGAIRGFSMSVGIGAQDGAAGSITNSVVVNNAQALVRGASVTAANNVLLSARNVDEITAVAGAVGIGGSKGIGVSAVVNVVYGDTVAAVESANGTASTIQARGTGTAATVDNGKVATPYDYTNASNIAQSLIALSPDLSNGTRTVSGLSVNAISRQSVSSAALSIGASGSQVGAAISPVVNVLGGTTEARIVGADVNRTGGTTDAAEIAVIATSNTFVQNAVVAGAVSSKGAGAGSVATNTMSRTTNAFVTDTDIGNSQSVGAIDVQANGIMDSVNIVAGLAIGGSGGLAGSVVVNVFDASTLAKVSGGAITAASLGVKAMGDTGFLGVAGSGAGGSFAMAGAFNISVNEGSTQALVGEAGSSTTLALGGDLSVDATSRDEIRTYAVGGAVGAGSAAIAGMLNVGVIASDTIASVSHLGASTMRHLDVTASNVLDVKPVTAGFAVAANTGIGAAINIVVAKATVSANLLQSAITATGKVKVAATGERYNDMLTATAGAGATVGIGAAISVFVAGSGLSTDVVNELGSTLTAADAQADENSNASFGGSSTAAYTKTGSEAGAAPKADDPNALKRQSVLATSLASNRRDTVSAAIVGGSLKAGETIVLADSKVQSTSATYGFGLGGKVGVGAALGFSNIDQLVTATVDGDLDVASLSVSALSGMPGTAAAVSQKSLAGAGGLLAGIGAAVAMGDIDSRIEATVAGIVKASGTVKAEAKDSLTVVATSDGDAIAGGLAVGLSIAQSDRNATVVAKVGPNATVQNATGLALTAGSTGSSTASATALAGGAGFAVAGASGKATDSSTILAEIGTGSVLTNIGSNGVVVSASATPQVKAESLGVAVAGTVAVGASVAEAYGNANVQALVGNSVEIATTGRFSLTADLALGTADTLHAYSRAGAGSVFLAAQASVARASMTGVTKAAIGTGLDLATGSSDIEVAAKSRTKQVADVTGVSLGSLALGASVASVGSDVTTTADIGDKAKIAGDDMTVSADGADENVAKAVSGAGGLVAGSAAVVSTNTVSNTHAAINEGSDTNGIVLNGKLTIAAAHLGAIGGSVDSINAGLLGASGSIATHTVSSEVTALVGESANVEAGGLDVSAVNRTHRLFSDETGVDLRSAAPNSDGSAAAWNINSGSGGIVNAPAGSSKMTVSHVTSAGLGRDASVKLGSTTSPTKADVSAYNEMIVHDKAKLDSGGAIAIADTRADLDVLRNDASVLFDVGSSLVLANGNIRAAAFDNAHLDLRTVSTTYGLAGAPSGRARIDYRRSNRVTVAENAKVEANSADDILTGSVSLSAGAGLDGALSSIKARAVTDYFNNTAFPISGAPQPVVVVDGNSDVLVAGGSTTANAGVRAAGNIYLTASRGSIDTRAVGTGKDIYREALAAIASGVSQLFGGDPVSFDYKGGEARTSGIGSVTINGTVRTGIRKDRALTLNYSDLCAGSASICIASIDENDIAYSVQSGLPIGTTILARLDKLRSLLSDYGSDPVASGAYRSEINFLEAKLIGLGLASKEGEAVGANAPTELAKAKSDLANNRLNLASLGARFDLNAETLGSSATSAGASGIGIFQKADQVVTLVSTAKTATDAILAGARNLADYGGGNATANATDVASINTLLSNNTQLATEIGTARTNLDTANQALATSKGTIAQQQQVVAAKLLDLQKAGVTPSEVTQLNQDIETARQTIATESATLATKLGDVKTQSDAIKAKSETVASNVRDIDLAQTRIVARSKGSAAGATSAIDANILNLSDAADDTGSVSSAIATQATQVGTSQSQSTNATTAIGAYATTKAVYVSDIANIETKIANNAYSNVDANAPTTSAISIADTVARLGDVVVVADRLIGSGTLSAPGDASISITNNTAASLKLGNLTVDSDSGGHVRFNGVSVSSNTAIAALNAGGATASFGAIETGVNSASLPSISIKSNYSVDSAAFYDPSSSISYKKVANPAPDIILEDGKSLTNLRGKVTIASQSGNIYATGQINAGQVGIEAKNGDFVKSFTYGFEHIGGDPATPGIAKNGIVANGAINISARFLNLNGLIQSGIADWNLTIAANPEVLGTAAELGYSNSDIQTLRGAHSALLTATPGRSSKIEVVTGLWYDMLANGGQGQFSFTANYAKSKQLAGNYALDAAAGNIGASYDAGNDRFVVDGTNVRGGSIQLFGQIFNTSATGAQLNVLDGFGQINVNNLDGRAVVLGKLDTGEDPTGAGRGTAGRIEITDVRLAPTAAGQTTASRQVDAVKTVYTRLNGAVTVSTDVGTLASNGAFVASCGTNCATVTTTAGRASGYDPQTGLRYNYATGVDNSTTTRTEYTANVWLGNSNWSTDSRYTPVGSPTTISKTAVALSEGNFLSLNTQVGVVKETYSNGTPITTMVSSWSSCNWWSLCASKTFHVIGETVTPSKTITSTTLKADNRIGVNFIGYDTGALTIASTGNVLLAGVINNKIGATSIQSSGSILKETSTAMVNSASLDMKAGGSIGSLDTGKAIAVTLYGGALSAGAGAGNTVIDANSDMLVGRITAAGDVTNLQGRVVLSAAGSISAASGSIPTGANARIEANRVELTSRGGSIGSTSAPLLVNTGFTDTAALRPFGDPTKGAVLNTYQGLKATAAGDIGIEAKAWVGNADGTILVDRVVSTGGNVTLKTRGAILDNNPIESVDQRTYADLLSYWDSLGLRQGQANSDKADAVIRAFETQVASDKRVYDQLVQRSGMASYDAAFSYKMSVNERLSFEASVKLGEPGISSTDLSAKVAAFESGQTSLYHRTHAATASLTGTFDGATGAYTASSTEVAARKAGAVWTDRQLAFSLSPGALKTITGTNIVQKDSNVSGRVVTLSAAKGLGELSGAVEIDPTTAPGQLTDAQKIVLATAERSDFLSNSANGWIRIEQVRMLNFDAATRLDAAISNAASNAYLATNGSARLGAISVPGELRLKARGSIVNEGTGLDVSAGSYILEASGGGIGYSRALDGTSVAGTLKIKPVNTGSATLGYKGAIIARAADEIDLHVVEDAGVADSGDANLDTVYSRKSVKVVADKSIRNATGDKLINVLGDTVDLAARNGSIGSGTERLNLGNGLSGRVDATATGSIHLFAPDSQHLTLGTLVANGGLLSVVAGDALGVDLTIQGVLTASTSVDLDATGALSVLAGGRATAQAGFLSGTAASIRMLTGSGFTASDKIALTTTGDALVTNLVAGASASDAVRITSGARILGGTAAGRTDIETTGQGSGIVLAAATGIGSARVANDTLGDAAETAVLNPLRLRTGLADLGTATGGIAARFLDDVSAVVRDRGGSVDLSAEGAFASTFIGADLGSVRIDAARAVSIDTIAAGGTIDVAGLDAVRVVTGTSGADLSLAAGTSLDADALTSSTGAVRLNANGGALAARSVNAAGDFNAISTGDMAIDTVSGSSVSLASGGSIRVSALQSAGSIAADAAGGLTLLRGVSGGSQTLGANGDLVFNYLQTLGIASDPGDIRLTSRQGSVLGGEALAQRDLIIDAKNALAFTKLKALRDLRLTVGGALKGTDLDAGRELGFDVAGDAPIRLATLRGSNLKMSGNGPLVIDNAIVSQSARLEGSSITVSKLTYTGSEQLVLALSGYRGSVADRIAMDIDAPTGVRIEDLRVADSRFVTNASAVQIERGFITGTLQLTTADRAIWMNNRSPRPVLGNDIQLYRPDFAFGLDQSGNATTTSSYVLRYGAGTDARMVSNGEIYRGTSFVRDAVAAMQDGSGNGSAPARRSLTRMSFDAMVSLFRSMTGSVLAPFGVAVQLNDDGADREEGRVE